MAKKGPNDDNTNPPGPARAKAARPRTRRSSAKQVADTVQTSPVQATPVSDAGVETYEGREYALHEIADDRSISGPHGDALLQPSEDEIRYRAYQRYIARGGQHGADFDDWLQAEQELRRR